jgi:TRAP-type mannitol/chloroaromatic compound transport system permease small subunit
MIVILIYEIIVRSIFGRPTLWGYEMAGMLFGAYCIVVGAYTHKLDGHVRMDVFYGGWRPRTKARAETLTSLLTIGFLLIFLWISVSNAWESWSMLEYSGTAWGPPLFPLKTMICIGVLLLLMQAVVHFFRNLKTATTREETS